MLDIISPCFRDCVTVIASLVDVIMITSRHLSSAALHLEPHARGDVWVATAPLWVEAGNVFVKVEGVDVQPSSEYGRVVSAAFTWLKNAINVSLLRLYTATTQISVDTQLEQIMVVPSALCHHLWLTFQSAVGRHAATGAPDCSRPGA